jgi:hypothetical protein
MNFLGTEQAYNPFHRCSPYQDALLGWYASSRAQSPWQSQLPSIGSPFPNPLPHPYPSVRRESCDLDYSVNDLASEGGLWLTGHSPAQEFCSLTGPSLACQSGISSTNYVGTRHGLVLVLGNEGVSPTLFLDKHAEKSRLELWSIRHSGKTGFLVLCLDTTSPVLAFITSASLCNAPSACVRFCLSQPSTTTTF